MCRLFITFLLAVTLASGRALVAPGLLHHVTDPSLQGVVQHTGAVVMSKVAATYRELLVQHPLLTKMATGGCLATCGDAIAQSQTPETYDRQRAASFMAFDMAYRAVQHVSFPIIVHECQGQYLGRILSSLHLSSAMHLPAIEQTLASQLGIVPFFYYPVFFTMTAFIQGLSTQGAVERARENFLPLMKRNLLFWIPVQFVQFGFVDENLQIPFLSVAGLCWTFILSVAAGSARSYNKTNASDHSSPKEVKASQEAFKIGKEALSAGSSK